jgi:uncharacterized membrane-anchored protein YhcB (DUF1043 family)
VKKLKIIKPDSSHFNIEGSKLKIIKKMIGLVIGLVIGYFVIPFLLPQSVDVVRHNAEIKAKNLVIDLLMKQLNDALANKRDPSV